MAWDEISCQWELVTKLEEALNNNNSDAAGQCAELLANSRAQCRIKLITKNNHNAVANIKISVSVEAADEVINEFSLTISTNFTVGQLKQQIETRYGHPIERQVAFFGRHLVRDDTLRICECDYKLGVVIYLKKNYIRKNEEKKRNSVQEKPSGKRKLNLPLNRKSKEVPVIGWKCEKCTFVNRPTRPGCEVCSADRPTTYVIPKKFQDEERKRQEGEDQLYQEYETALVKSREENWQKYQQIDNLSLVASSEKFECAICLTEIEPDDGVQLRNCLHQFCKQCLSESINHCEDPVVKCPFQNDEFSCESVLEDREIRQLVSDEIVERLMNRSMAFVETQSKNAFHCKKVDCKGWCFFEDGVQEYHCELCESINCIPCRAIHTGETCKQYQEKLEILARTDKEAKATKEGLDRMLANGEAMRCPNCQVIIIKNGGCDGLNCRNCNVALCWATKGLRWGPKGHGDTSGGCRCRVNGQSCHPQCQNCH